MSLNYPKYPFAALVGLDPLKTALLLNAIFPAIGGVLIRGEKGTAKSTAARALRDVLPTLSVVEGCPYHCNPSDIWLECPHCSARPERKGVDRPVPFVELPLGATEDRVLGTLDFEKALREGQRVFQPGLLAEAHRGILYIDEVNLLADHLVDVLLDAAAMGVNTVERESVSVTHPARFLLIGTMNPEEGDLRPQLLDRFGLMVSVAGPRDPLVRAQVVRRRLSYESDPAAFEVAWQDQQHAVREQISRGRTLVPSVMLEEGLTSFISQLCCEMEVDGLRGDLVLNKTARALAALHGRVQVTLDDIRLAAEMVLPHRRRRKPFERPGIDRQKLDELFALHAEPKRSPQDASSANTSHVGEPQPDVSENPSTEERNRIFDAAPAPAVGRIEVSARGPVADPPPGRRNFAAAQSSGSYSRATTVKQAGGLAVDATVRAAMRRGPRADGKIDIKPDDVHYKLREGKTGTILLFIVDASGSMAARQRMALVKGAVLSLLQSAYEKRDLVGVIAFRGVAAEVLLAPTRNVELAEQALRHMPTGGRTPLAHALVLASELFEKVRQAHSGTPLLLVLLSDGKANVPLTEVPGDPFNQAIDAAGRLAEAGVPALVLDSDVGFVRVGRTRELADALRGEYLPLDQLSAEELVLKIQQRVHEISPGKR